MISPMQIDLRTCRAFRWPGKRCSALSAKTASCSLEAVICTRLLPHSQDLAGSGAHVGAHADGDGASHAHVLAVAAQRITQLRAVVGAGRIDIGDGGAHAGLDGLQPHIGRQRRCRCAACRRGIHRTHRRRLAPGWAKGAPCPRLLHGHRQLCVEHVQPCRSRHQQWEVIGKLVRDLGAAGPVEAGEAALR